MLRVDNIRFWIALIIFSLSASKCKFELGGEPDRSNFSFHRHLTTFSYHFCAFLIFIIHYLVFLNILVVEEEEDITPIGTQTPQGSFQNLRGSLESTRPSKQAIALETGPRRGPKQGKTSILTGDEEFNEIEAQQNARDAKKAAEERKAAATLRKQVAAQEKLEL